MQYNTSQHSTQNITQVETRKKQKNNNGASLASVITVLLIIILFVKFVIPGRNTTKFDVDNQHITLHLNQTDQFSQVEAFVQHFHKAIKTLITNISSADISLSSSDFDDEDLNQLFSTPLPQLTNLKLNLGSTRITDNGLQNILNKIPNTVSTLDLSLDAIDSVHSSGALVGKLLPRLKNLRNLRVSFILSELKNEGGIAFLQGLKQLTNIQSLTLVLMGDNLSVEFGRALKEYLTKSQNNLKVLSLNLFSNKFGAEGIKPIAEGLQLLKNLDSLEIDLYFNNLTAVGTESLSNSLSKLTQLKELRLNLDFNGITNDGGQHIGKALTKLSNLESLDLGVATKNFGYLGYKYVIEGLQTLSKLRKLNLRCGVNKVGVNGASITAEAFQRLPLLEQLSINFLQNFVGDEGALILAQSIVNNLHALRVLHFDVSFNGIRGDGLTKVLKSLSEKRFDELIVSGSSNELRNVEVKKMVPQLQKLLRRNKFFKFQFLNTAITGKGERLLRRTFQNYPFSLVVNTIELTEQQKKNHPDDNVDYTEPQNVGSYYETERNSEDVRRQTTKKVEQAKKKAEGLRQKQIERKQEQAKKKKIKEQNDRLKAEAKKKEEQNKKQQARKQQQQKKRQEQQQKEQQARIEKQNKQKQENQRKQKQENQRKQRQQKQQQVRLEKQKVEKQRIESQRKQKQAQAQKKAQSDKTDGKKSQTEL